MKPAKLIAFVVLFVPCVALRAPSYSAKIHRGFSRRPSRSQYLRDPRAARSDEPSNRGFANNPGFIVTAHGVIDPGSSIQIGRELLRKIRAISTKPVIAVLNTHVHGDHWLGNYAIRLAYPKVPIYAHAKMIERVAPG